MTKKKYRLLHWRRRERDFLFVFFWIQLTNRHYRLDTSHGTNSEYIWGGWWWLDTIPILRTKHQNTGCLSSIFQTYRPGQPNLEFCCGYPTVWIFSNFSCTLILLEINFGWFQRLKNCRFNNFGSFKVLSFWEFYTRKCQKYPKIQNSALSNWSKWQFLSFRNQPKLISSKIQWQDNC